LNENDARRVVLVRAIELADRDHEVWPRGERRQVTREAAAEGGEAHRGASASSEEAFIARRAALASARLDAAHPELARAGRRMEWPRRLGWLLPAAAFALGVAANELGAERRINIISFPLIGMLAWNAAVYAAIMAGLALSIGRGRRGVATEGPATRALMRLMHAGLPRHPQGPLARAIERYHAEWSVLALPLDLARARVWLHMAAAALAAGAVAGLYVRGLAFEYLAGWESTFLGAREVHRMLSMVLGPASALTGIAIPGVDEIAALRWSDARAGVNAAPWIHLYAMTAVLFIVGPRLALAAANALVARQLRRHFPLPLVADPYFRKLVAARDGASGVVRLVPYSYRADAAARQALRALFAEACGRDMPLAIEESVGYGSEDDYQPDLGSGGAGGLLVALFNLATTPEAENHGVFVERLVRAARASEAPWQVMAVLDEAPYRRRSAGRDEADARLKERRAAWEELLAARAVPVVSIDSKAHESAPAIRRLEEVLSTLHPAFRPS
jgi:hypothetical protein